MKLNKLNKKIFNSLDIVVLAVFVVLFALLAVKTFTSASETTEVITVTVTADRVPDDIIPSVKEGDKLYAASGELVGTVTKMYTVQATEIFADTRVDSGNRWPLVTVDVPDHSRMVITVSVDAVVSDRGYSVHGTDIKVNGDIEFCINGFSADGYFSSVTGGERK